jgi:hypothetical protein
MIAIQMKFFRDRDLIKVEKLICRAASNLDKLCIDKRTRNSLCAGNENISERYFAEKDRSLKVESDRIDHKGEDNLNLQRATH